MLKSLVVAAGTLFFLSTAMAQVPLEPQEKIITPIKTTVAFQMDKAALKELPSIKAATQEFQEAWNDRDVKAVLKQYTDKASVMDHEGNQAMGTPQIQSWLQQSFAGLYKNAVSNFEVSNVRMLGTSMALVDILMTSNNLAGRDGQILGPQEFHVTVVGQKKANKWLIQDMRSYQFTRPQDMGIGGAGNEPYDIDIPKEEFPQP